MNHGLPSFGDNADLSYSLFEACKRRDGGGSRGDKPDSLTLDFLTIGARPVGEKGSFWMPILRPAWSTRRLPVRIVPFPLPIYILDFLLRAAALYADPFELNVYCSRAPVFVLLVIHRGARSRGRAPGASRRAVKTRLVLSTKFTNATRRTAHRSPDNSSLPEPGRFLVSLLFFFSLSFFPIFFFFCFFISIYKNR